MFNPGNGTTFVQNLRSTTIQTGEPQGKRVLLTQTSTRFTISRVKIGYSIRVTPLSYRARLNSKLASISGNAKIDKIIRTALMRCEVNSRGEMTDFKETEELVSKVRCCAKDYGLSEPPIIQALPAMAVRLVNRTRTN